MKNYIKKEITRNNIKRGFHELVSQRNVIDKITISQLTNYIGINRSTFYLHYNNINAVGIDIEEDIISKLFSDKFILKTLDDLIIFIEHCTNYISENRNFFLPYIESNDLSYFILRFKTKTIMFISKSFLKEMYNDQEKFFNYINFYFDGFFSQITTSIKNDTLQSFKVNSIELLERIMNI